MEKIKTGIIGFGRVATNHLTKLRETGLFDLVGVCDITESRRKAAEIEGLKATSDLGEFLCWDLEFVLITTHSSAHYTYALKVAAAKKHMLIEKPMALDRYEAEEMVQAAKDNDIMLTINHSRRFDKDYRNVKHAISCGVIGDIVSIENRTMGSQPAIEYGVPDYNQRWRVTAATGGGSLLDFGPHWVEQILDLIPHQKIVSVFADVRNIKWGDSDDLFDITMVLENGIRARAAKADISYYPLPYKWIILGNEATLVCPSNPKGKVRIFKEGDSQQVWTKAMESKNLYENISNHLHRGEKLIFTPEHSLRVMKVLHAARESGNSGKSIDVNI